MLILGSLEVAKDEQIVLPFYHRAPLSLMSGTDVSMCFVPKEASRSSQPLPEIIISTIPYNAWDSCWRLNAAFNDAPGVVFKLLDVLASLDMNIHVHESGSVDVREVHEIEVVFDAKKYFAKNKRGYRSQDEEMKRLQAMLRCLFIDDLDISENGPRLSVKRMKGLYRVSQAAMKTMEGNEPLHKKSKVEAKSIVIPEDIVEALKDNGCEFTTTEPRFMLICDTRDRLLRVLFPMKDQQILHARIVHKSVSGALAGITKCIKDHFDIINCLTRQMSKGRNEFDLLISPIRHSRSATTKGSAWMKEKLEQALNVSKRLEALHIDISYPDSIGKRSTTIRQPSRVVSKYVYEPVRGYNEKEILDTIRAKIRKYESTLGQNHLDRQAEERLAFLRNHAVEFIITNPRKLFVSFNFGENDKLDILQRECKRHGIDIVTGHDPAGKPIFRDVIMERIADCPVFLAIWTGTKREISPWFLWELGVAHAYRKTAYMVIDSRIDPDCWQKIMPEKHHFVFVQNSRADGFSAHLRKAVDAVIRSMNDGRSMY